MAKPLSPKRAARRERTERIAAEAEAKAAAVDASGEPRPNAADCELIIRLGKEGKHATQVACALGVTRMTVYNWKDANPAFKAAWAMYQQESQAYWEGKANEAASGANKSIDTKALIFIMRARYAQREVHDESWKDITGRELSGPGGGPIKHSVDAMSREECERLLKDALSDPKLAHLLPKPS